MCFGSQDGQTDNAQVDTLMRYLIDSLQRYETDQSDALCPMQTEADQSFMGDHVLICPVTTDELRLFSSAMLSMVTKAVKPSLTTPDSDCVIFPTTCLPSPFPPIH